VIWVWVLVGVLSVILALLGWFCFRTTRDLLFLSDELGEMQERVEEYRGHLEIVYGLETFYGDETLGNLLRHTKDFERYLGTFNDITDLSLPENIEEEEPGSDEYEQKEKNNTSQEKTTRTGKVVFHQGS
jgi:hypothetical protein